MLTNKKNGKPHYAWLILISCIAFYSATMGMLVNTAGIYMPPILKDMGWSATQYSAAGILTGLVSVVTLTFVDKAYKRFSTKWVLFFAVLAYALGYLLKAFTQSYWYYCAVCAFIGVGGAFVLYVPAPMLINAWFEEKKGFALGICMLSSGLAGAVMNPIVSALIENLGWRRADIISSIIPAVIACPLILLFVVKTPEEKGLKAYGAKSETVPEKSERYDENHGKDAQEFFNNRFSEKEKKRKIILCIILAMLLNLLSCVSGQLANFASSRGLAAVIGATLTTALMIGNLSSKAVIGICMDKFGRRNTLLVTMIMVSSAYIILGLSEGSIIMMYICVVVLGITAAHNTMVMPAMVGTFAIGDEYTKYISKVTMGTMLASAFSGVITSGLYDLIGSYSPVWILYGMIQMICIVLFLRLYNEKWILHLHRSGK